jgi:anti-sigma factor RsiW
MGTKSETPEDDALVARDATYYKAPDHLRTRIRAHVAEQARERDRPPALWRWLGFGATCAAVAVLSWNAALMGGPSGADDRLAGEVMSAHVRSLLGDTHLNDVASTDQHTVKPWFQGRIDFAPEVTDLASAGFALDGGRLDYINGRPVAAVTYRHRLHVINLFEWPAASVADSRPALLARNGYSMVRWTHGGMQYWAVSDSAGNDLLQFAHLLLRD